MSEDVFVEIGSKGTTIEGTLEVGKNGIVGWTSETSEDETILMVFEGRHSLKETAMEKL